MILSRLSQIPSEMADAIAFCLAASHGRHVPSSDLDYDHLLGFILSGSGVAA